MNWLLLIFAAVDIALLAWTFRDRDFAAPRLWLLRFLLLGMFYDNLVQGSGNWFIEEGWYAPANIPRFVLHASVLPFLTLFGLSVFCWLFTACALGWGLYHEVALLELGPRSALGVTKLGSLSSMPPVATILTNILVLPMAAAVWRVAGWPWFFLGGMFIFVVNGATAAQPWGFLVGNFAEVVFVLSLLQTHWRFAR